MEQPFHKLPWPRKNTSIQYYHTNHSLDNSNLSKAFERERECERERERNCIKGKIHSKYQNIVSYSSTVTGHIIMMIQNDDVSVSRWYKGFWRQAQEYTIGVFNTPKTNTYTKTLGCIQTKPH
jgi:hypothetical protein